ncbi:hypothetical protein MRY87_10375 [bacterium]|nr:hypothetical protein [bacterium]
MKCSPFSQVIRVLFVTLLLSGAVYALSLRYTERFPETDAVLPDLRKNPVQEPTEVSPFVFSHHGIQYRVEPVRDYEIAGLVVSHNNISSITDAYHTSTSVDFRDLCVVWGQNAKKDLLDQMHFWSEPWTCWTKPKTMDAQHRFFPDELSNNHLLSDDAEVRRTIEGARVGDQIRLRGYLINYGIAGSGQIARRSSLVRTDTGNGACETIFVEDAKILRTANSGWRLISSGARRLSLFLLIVLPLLWIWDIQRTYSARKRDLELRIARSPHLRNR